MRNTAQYRNALKAARASGLSRADMLDQANQFNSYAMKHSTNRVRATQLAWIDAAVELTEFYQRKAA